MAVLLCPEKIVCEPGAGALGVEFPFANLTSEDPDRQVFVGQGTGFVWWPPPIGSNWSSSHCLGVCESFISQEDADICAALNNLLCLDDDWGTCPPPPCPTEPPGGPGGPGDGPAGPFLPYNIFTNNVQTCTVNCTDGSPFTYQVAAGMFAGSSQEMADRIAFSFACRTATLRLICLGEILAWGCVDEVFFTVLQATAPANTTLGFSVVSGSLPPGLNLVSFGSQSATISGIPTTPGVYTFRIRAIDTLLNFMEKNYTISILGILTPSPLADGEENVAYNAFLSSAGGTGTVTYSISAGTLPAGLTLDGTGFIFGTPTVSGDFSFTLRITDSSTPARVCDKDFSLHIDPPTGCPAWGNLAWPFSGFLPSVVSVPPGSASFTPLSGSTNAFIGLADSGDEFGSAAVQNDGGLIYNGPGCNCNLHVQGTTIGLPANLCGSVTITDITAATTLATFNWSTAGAAFNTDVPFTVPDTLGSNHQLRVLVFMQTCGIYFSRTMISASGNITNV